MQTRRTARASTGTNEWAAEKGRPGQWAVCWLCPGAKLHGQEPLRTGLPTHRTAPSSTPEGGTCGLKAALPT